MILHPFSVRHQPCSALDRGHQTKKWFKVISLKVPSFKHTMWRDIKGITLEGKHMFFVSLIKPQGAINSILEMVAQI